MIYTDHGVYLLNAVLVERELLRNQLMKAANELDVKEIITKLKGKELKPKTNSIKYTQVRWS